MVRAQGSVEQLVRARATEHPDATWLRWEDETVSWRAALSAGQRAANGLLEMGVRPGDSVALMMSNRPEFIWLHLGVLMIGAYSVPVNISQRGAALAHILADSDATTVIFQSDLRDQVVALAHDLPALRHLVVADGPPAGPVPWTVDRVMAGEDRDPPVSYDEATGGVGIMYTSGTTGPPKGVVSTRFDLTPLMRLLDTSGVRTGETMYTGLPLYHGNALLVSMVGSMYLDAQFALAPRFSASRLFDDCRRHHAVEFNALGAMIPLLLKQPRRRDDRDHDVRVVLSAGCPAESWEEFEERFGVRIVEWFGMVDSPGILLNDGGPTGSMGRSGVSGVEFRVVDDEDRPLGPGRVGELVFRHPMGRLTHYHKMPEATDEAYRGGWFHSGDLAEHDDEGNFRYRGRKKESMRRRGENISAWEIESVVDTHPAVLASAAHAVPCGHGEDEVKVCVVARPGHDVTPTEILDFCRGRMAHYAVPRYVELVHEIPRTATQRNQYSALRARGLTPRTWDRERSGYCAVSGSAAGDGR